MRKTCSPEIAVFTIALSTLVCGSGAAMALTPTGSVAMAPTADGRAAMEEPATDLPMTAAPQVDFITLFPNQAEIPPGPGLNGQRFGYVLHGEARAVYESNLFIRSRDQQEDVSFRISPGVAIGWGEFKSEFYEREDFRPRFDLFSGRSYIYIDYSPSYTWYADHRELDTFDHAGLLKSEWAFQRLALGTYASYDSAEVPVDEIGDRVEQKHLGAALSSRYALNARWSLDVNGFYEGFDFDRDGVDHREWRNEDWLDYRISPQFSIGLGGAFAWVNRDGESGQDYEQGRLRAVYQPSEKFSLAVSGGTEWRSVEEGIDQSNGVFQCELSWTPSEDAVFYLRGYRQTLTGQSEGSDFNVATGACARYRQRVFHGCYVGCAAGYQNSKYQGEPGDAGSREDNLFFIRPGVEFDLAAWLNCEIAGEYRKNDSNEQFGYAATKATVRFSLLF